MGTIPTHPSGSVDIRSMQNVHDHNRICMYLVFMYVLILVHFACSFLLCFLIAYVHAT